MHREHRDGGGGERYKSFEACNFIKKETLAQVLSCESYEILRAPFFTEHLWATASGCDKYSYCVITSNIQDFHILRFHVYTPTISFLTNILSLNTKLK